MPRATQLIAAFGWRPIARCTTAPLGKPLPRWAASTPAVVPIGVALAGGNEPVGACCQWLAERASRIEQGTLRSASAAGRCQQAGAAQDRRHAGEAPPQLVILRSAPLRPGRPSRRAPLRLARCTGRRSVGHSRRSGRWTQIGIGHRGHWHTACCPGRRIRTSPSAARATCQPRQRGPAAGGGKPGHRPRRITAVKRRQIEAGLTGF